MHLMHGVAYIPVDIITGDEEMNMLMDMQFERADELERGQREWLKLWYGVQIRRSKACLRALMR